MEKEGGKETCNFLFLVLGLNQITDESKKILGILYRSMKPLLEDFSPEMTCAYDECLKGIANEQYIQSARDLKGEYGIPSLFYRISHRRY